MLDTIPQEGPKILGLPVASTERLAEMVPLQHSNSAVGCLA